MRVFRHKREDTLGAYNFGYYQIYVCTLSNTKGQTEKGITVLSTNNYAEIPFALTKEKALALANYLDSVADGNIPNKFKLKGSWSNALTSMYFSFSKMENDMLKGRISLALSTAWVTVKPSSVRACSKALNKLYSEIHA